MTPVTVSIRNTIASAIAGDSAISAWLQTAFSATTSLAVKKGFILVSDLREDWFPGVAVALGDDVRNSDGQTWELNATATCFITQKNLDPAQAEERIVTLAELVSAVFLPQPANTLSGLAICVLLEKITTDGGSLLPKLFRSVHFKIIYERK